MYPELVQQAEAGMAALEEKIGNRDLYRMRRDWFRRRARPPAPDRSEREAPDGARGYHSLTFSSTPRRLTMFL